MNSKNFKGIASPIKYTIKDRFICPFSESANQNANNYLYQNTICNSLYSIINDILPQYTLSLPSYFLLNDHSQDAFIDVHEESNINSASNFVSILSPPQEEIYEDFDFLIS